MIRSNLPILPIQENFVRKTDVSIHKQAAAVCRLEGERRSTPMQQFNDLRYITSTTPWLERCLRDTPILYKVTDAGWDHCPRCYEVQWSQAEHHLEYDRDQDSHMTRAKGQSGRSHAERVQSVITGSVTRSSMFESVRAMQKPNDASQL